MTENLSQARIQAGHAYVNTPNDVTTNALVEAWSPLFHQWAHQYANREYDSNDVYQMSVRALLTMYQQFHQNDAPNDNQLVNELRLVIQNQTKPTRHLVSMDAKVVKPLVEAKVDAQAINSDYRLDVQIAHTYLKRAVATLANHEAAVVTLRYGLDTDVYHSPLANEFADYGQTTDQIAGLLGVNEGAISDIVERSIGYLHYGSGYTERADVFGLKYQH